MGGYVVWELGTAAAEVVEVLRLGETYRAATDLLSEASPKLLGLADRAVAEQAPEWVVGTLLYLAAKNEDPASMAALVQQLLSSDAPVEERARRRRAAAYWRKRLLDIKPFQNTGGIARSFRAADEAIEADRSVREGALARGYKLVVKGDEKPERVESDLKTYRMLFEPLPVWRPRVAPRLLSDVLALEFPHLAEAACAVADAIASESAALHTPVVLVGPPGVGKDAIWRRACELSGRPVIEFDLAGSSDNKTLKGTARGWSNRLPALPTIAMARFRVANPAIHLSELEKAGGSSQNGIVHEALLNWLDRDSAKSVFDEGLGRSIDYSLVAFCFSANAVATIPPALRTRLRFIEAPPIGREHVEALVASGVRRRAIELGIDANNLPLPNRKIMNRLRVLAVQGRLNLRGLGRLMQVIYPSDRAVVPGIRH